MTGWEEICKSYEVFSRVKGGEKMLNFVLNSEQRLPPGFVQKYNKHFFKLNRLLHFLLRTKSRNISDVRNVKNKKLLTKTQPVNVHNSCVIPFLFPFYRFNTKTPDRGSYPGPCHAIQALTNAN